MPANGRELRSCSTCGLIHRVPRLDVDEVARCTRCLSAIRLPKVRDLSAGRTAAAAIGAFFLFWPAVLLPILRIEQLGQVSESSIVEGVIDLFRHGDWFVASVVLLFSIVFPLVKIIFLIELSLLDLLHSKHKALTYHIMEAAGKWSMMDVLLLAFMVMLVKLGKLVTFEFGPAVVAFVLCVTMSLIASISFDPHGLWEEAHSEENDESQKDSAEEGSQ